MGILILHSASRSRLTVCCNFKCRYQVTWVCDCERLCCALDKRFKSKMISCLFHTSFLIIKPTGCTNFSNLFLEGNSTCLGHFLCPSLGVFYCMHSNGICHTGSRTACLQAVKKPVWHIPLLCVHWKTPDDGQRNCPKHEEFPSKNKFEKLVHLVGFIIRNLSRCTVTWTSNPYFMFVKKKGGGPTIKFVCLFLILLLIQPFHSEICKNVLYIILSFIWVTTMGNGGVGQPLFNILNLSCSGHRENGLFNSSLITLYRPLQNDGLHEWQ